MKKIFRFRNILIFLIVVFAGMQFFRIDKTNPPVAAENDFIHIYKPPADVEKLLRVACYDCHSNETLYPWYSSIAPVSWWLKDHINEGREEMNFSNWTSIKPEKRAKKIKYCAKMIKKGEMPLASYTWGHSEARLSAEQKNALMNWLNSIADSGPSKEEMED